MPSRERKETSMRRKSTRLAAALAVCLVGLFVSAAAAQQATTTTETKAFEVVSVDGNQVIARLADGTTKEYTVPEDFRFNVGGQQMSVHELKPGMKGKATITTTTTVKPVTVTEVKNGTVMQVIGNTIVVRTADGNMKMFSEGDVEKRNVRIMRDGQPIMLSELHANDHLTATIVTEKPPQVVTERQVKASIASGQPPMASASAAAPGAGASSAGASSAASAQAAGMSADASTRRHLPKTASSLPALALTGALLLAFGGTL